MMPVSFGTCIKNQTVIPVNGFRFSIHGSTF